MVAAQFTSSMFYLAGLTSWATSISQEMEQKLFLIQRGDFNKVLDEIIQVIKDQKKTAHFIVNVRIVQNKKSGIFFLRHQLMCCQDGIRFRQDFATK